mgnify:CR=1 FL=1
MFLLLLIIISIIILLLLLLKTKKYIKKTTKSNEFFQSVSYLNIESPLIIKGLNGSGSIPLVINKPWQSLLSYTQGAGTNKDDINWWITNLIRPIEKGLIFGYPYHYCPYSQLCKY